METMIFLMILVLLAHGVGLYLAFEAEEARRFVDAIDKRRKDKWAKMVRQVELQLAGKPWHDDNGKRL